MISCYRYKRIQALSVTILNLGPVKVKLWSPTGITLEALPDIFRDYVDPGNKGSRDKGHKAYNSPGIMPRSTSNLLPLSIITGLVNVALTLWGLHREIKGHNQANCQCNYNVITTMKENLYSSSHKDNQNKLYQANYDRIFKKQVPETSKVQRSKDNQ